MSGVRVDLLPAGRDANVVSTPAVGPISRDLQAWGPRSWHPWVGAADQKVNVVLSVAVGPISRDLQACLAGLGALLLPPGGRSNPGGLGASWRLQSTDPAVPAGWLLAGQNANGNC